MNKNIIARTLLVVALATPVLVSCDKDEERIVVSPSALSAPSATLSNVVLTATAVRANDPALTLSWNKVSHGNPLVSSQYDIIVTAPNGKTAILSPEVGAVSYTLTAKQLNDLLNDTFELTPASAQELSFVVRNYPIGTEVKDKTNPAVVYSAPTKVTATSVLLETPIIAPQEYRGVNYFFVGSTFPPANWDITSFDYPLFKDSPEATSYTYTGKFAAGGFKVKTADKNSWDNANGSAYGDAAGAISSDPGAGDIRTANAGYKTFSFSTGAYSIADYDASAATTYQQIGLVGSAVGGWPDGANPNDKVVLRQATYDQHIWVAKRIAVTEGEMKFRADNAWDVSWGGANDLFPASKINGGDNIRVSAAQAGTYDVWFNDITKHFIFIPTRR